MRKYLLFLILSTLFTMPNQMTSYQKGLVKQLKSNAEKYVRARSQAEYLEECISKNILPRSINLVRLVKSSSLWENNANETFEILFETSLKLIQDQLNEKRERYEKLDSESRELRSLLKLDIGNEQFVKEETRIKQHMSNVLRVEKVNKTKKILRDTTETRDIRSERASETPCRNKKRKNRRFRRHIPNASQQSEINVTNVMIASESSSDLNDHVSRIHGNVKNLSSHELTEHERSVLELGPKFCPVEHDINRARFQKDLNAGFRRMKLKEHFHPDEDTRTEEQKRFYVKNEEWEPPYPSASLKAHNMVIQHKFDLWKQPTRVARNLSGQQINAIKELKNNDSIDIKLDDKGGGFVLADSKDYKSSALNDLDNQTNINEIDPNTDKRN